MLLTAEAQIRRARGIALYNRGLLVAARDDFHFWLSLVDGSGEPALIIPPLNALAWVAKARGDTDGALAYVKRALVLSEDPSTQEMDRLKTYTNLVLMLTDAGRLDEALGFAEQGKHLADERDPNISTSFWVNVSKLYWRRQEWQSMHAASDRAIACSITAGDQGSRGKALLNRGIAHLELGAPELAEQDLRSALRLFEQHDLPMRAYACTELGRLHYHRGEHQAAIAAGRESLHVLLTSVNALDKEEIARISRLFGEIFSTSNQRNLALKYLNRAAAYFSQLGLRMEWQRSMESIGKVLSEPVKLRGGQVLQEVHQLDFVTALLDLTDDLECVDPYLRGHSERVASLAVILGETVGLSREELVTLSHAARLADVGMVAVDAELLNREGPLSDAELRRVAMHTVIGEEMLRPHGLPAPGLQAVRHHHEHFDGSGGPDGLRGEDIPLFARIVAVVDVYDALTSERPYRRALSHAGAIGELRAMAGHKLDPDLVERFLALFEV